MESYWQRLAHWLGRLLGRPTAPEAVMAEECASALCPRVLLINYDPVVSPGDRGRLTQVMGWHNVERLCQDFIADLQECSHGLVAYQIVDRIEVDAWPVKVDGFRYDGATFLQCWRERRGWHEPDAVDYRAILSDFYLLPRVESGQIDEVWLFGFPYAGFFESIMVGPGAFWCNAPPIQPAQGVARRFVIMGFNYERSVGPMLESFGHRVESHLEYAWRRQPGVSNLWKQFILYDKIAPGRANCGWMHYAPNSEIDYDWGNPRPVASNCDDWLHFPDSRGLVRVVDCREWGNGDMRAHHKWWFKHLPKAPGFTQGISNNWWFLGVDPNAVV
jgi:hypothetical protein